MAHEQRRSLNDDKTVCGKNGNQLSNCTQLARSGTCSKSEKAVFSSGRTLGDSRGGSEYGTPEAGAEAGNEEEDSEQEIIRVKCKQCGTLHRRFDNFYSLCSRCHLFYCPKCGLWMSGKEFIGHYKRRGDSCSNCRDRKYQKYGRQALSVRLRILVFHQDNFTCQYCGRSAPSVELHVDHKIPISKGGSSELTNLITACAECNLGKFDLMCDTVG